jgi:CRP/FNR family nitrogen fixation transcriptional regulator
MLFEPLLAGLPSPLCDDEQETVMRSILALRRGPVRYRRNQVIVCEGDPTDYVFLVISGVARSCRTFQNGARSIVAFHMPGELFGWSGDRTHRLSAEAAADALVLFVKRAALLAIGVRDSKVGNFLLTNTVVELRRVQEHSMMIGREAKCRLAAFLIDLSSRTAKGNYVDLPMSHHDIADYLGLTIETVSRTITELERSGLIARVSPRALMLRNRPCLLNLIN